MFKTTITITAKRGPELVKALRIAAEHVEARIAALAVKQDRGAHVVQKAEPRRSGRTPARPQQLRQAESLGVLDNPMSGVLTGGNKVIDFEVEYEVNGRPIEYSIVAIKRDGTEEEIGGGYPARGYAYASFENFFVGCFENSEGVNERPGDDRWEVRDNDGRVLFTKQCVS